jgi:hypothetical protein
MMILVIRTPTPTKNRVGHQWVRWTPESYLSNACYGSFGVYILLGSKEVVATNSVSYGWFSRLSVCESIIVLPRSVKIGKAFET